ncbi:sugar phosphate isomerase/epimerase family protein [Balneolaceae bacterium ANBcel3]|nr:sugar phosphate isomerase/epimerase family protein [Balneolaceae bacterium ANBcel3]
MTDRYFCGSVVPVILVFLILVCVSTVAFSQGDHEKFDPADPGVVSFTFRHQFEKDFEGTLDIIKEMGFQHIEFSNLFGYSAEEVRAQIDERGLRCTSLGVSYEEAVSNTRSVIERAHILGARHVRVAWIPHEPPFDLEDVLNAAEDFNKAGKVFRDAGLKFAYHNHGYEFSPHDDGTLFDVLLRETNPDYVSFQMDVFWVAHPGHDPAALLKRYPDRFISMHLKDLKKGVEGDYSGRAPSRYDVPLGQGQVDFPEVLRLASNTSIEYLYIEDETEDVHERVPLSLAYIRDLLSQKND